MQGAETSSVTEECDAVVVCNGHYSEVRRAELPGAEDYPGRIVHSHSYRDNEAFSGLTVIVIGASASGEDICREIALTADKVAFPNPNRQQRLLPGWLEDQRLLELAIKVRCADRILQSSICLQVYLSARSWQNPDWAHDSTVFGPRKNILRRGVPVRLHSDGSVEFDGGERAPKVDVIMHATGYKYTFPFLDGAGIVTVDDNR